MLQGKTVQLRPAEPADLALIARWRNSASNRQFFFSPFLIAEGGQHRWYEKLLTDPARVFFVIETVEGKPVGTVALDRIDWANRCCEGGQIVLDPDQRRFGYAEEALTLLFNFAFGELNLNRVYAYCFPFNRVIGLMKLYGFQEEGVLRNAVFAQGQFHDKVLIGLLREDWQG